MAETFRGYIETTQDVLLVFEGCRRGLLPRVQRRLQEKERKAIQSGSVFVFDEHESGIKRWTDGMVWSPSRILGNFLIYRELEKRTPEKRPLGDVKRHFSMDHAKGSRADVARDRQLVGSLSNAYKFRKGGLIKKTMSIHTNGVSQHLISYYRPDDVLQGVLRTPSLVPKLASLEISPDLLLKQNFRIPPMVEPTLEQDAKRDEQTSRSLSVGSLPNQIYIPNVLNNGTGYPQQEQHKPMRPIPSPPVMMRDEYYARYPLMSSASTPGFPCYDKARKSAQGGGGRGGTTSGDQRAFTNSHAVALTPPALFQNGGQNSFIFDEASMENILMFK